MKKAMQRADTLEAELQSTMTRHRTENEALIAQRSDLEEYLGSLKASHEALESKLAIAEDAKREAELRLARAVEGEGEARRLAEGLLADKRVLQETLAAMRLECTERWVRVNCRAEASDVRYPSLSPPLHPVMLLVLLPSSSNTTTYLILYYYYSCQVVCGPEI